MREEVTKMLHTTAFRRLLAVAVTLGALAAAAGPTTALAANEGGNGPVPIFGQTR